MFHARYGNHSLVLDFSLSLWKAKLVPSPEYWGKKDTDVPDVHSDVQGVQNEVNETRRQHQARIDLGGGGMGGGTERGDMRDGENKVRHRERGRRREKQRSAKVTILQAHIYVTYSPSNNSS